MKIRVDPEMLARWRAAAEAAAVSVSELVRDSVEVRITPAASRPSLGLGDTVVPPAPGATSVPIASAAERQVAAVSMRPREPVRPCSRESRHQKGVRCAYCQTTP